MRDVRRRILVGIAAIAFRFLSRPPEGWVSDRRKEWGRMMREIEREREEGAASEELSLFSLSTSHSHSVTNGKGRSEDRCRPSSSFFRLSNNKTMVFALFFIGPSDFFFYINFS